MPLQFIVRSADVAELKPLSFTIGTGKAAVQGIVVRKNGTCYAFRNECRHLPIALDLAGEDLMDATQSFLQCQSHGASYVIETGVCIEGPCVGMRLERWKVSEADGAVTVIVSPEDDSP